MSTLTIIHAVQCLKRKRGHSEEIKGVVVKKAALLSLDEGGKQG